jgi:hypothetical protein
MMPGGQFRKGCAAGLWPCASEGWGGKYLGPIMISTRRTFDYKLDVLRKYKANWCSARGIFPEHRCSGNIPRAEHQIALYFRTTSNLQSKIIRGDIMIGAPVLRKDSTIGAPMCYAFSHEARIVVQGDPVMVYDWSTSDHTSVFVRNYTAIWCSARGIFPEHWCSGIIPRAEHQFTVYFRTASDL